MLKKFALLSSSAAIFILASSGAAHAQSDSSTTIEELVVTAEKREQSLQDVPVAISAYSSETRDLLGINSVQDITNFTPGLAYDNGTDRITLRGVGRSTNVHAADGAVAIYSDGIYTSSSFEASKQPLFIDRVEVLRGPQGTLYGRNSIGGAINVLSKRPTHDFTAEVRATYGNYNYGVLAGTISGPITEGLRYRVNAQWEKQTDGWYQNTAVGGRDGGNIIDQTYFEAQLAADFGDHAEGWIKLSNFAWNNQNGGLGATAGYTPSPYDTTQENSTNFYLNPGFACSGVVFNVVNASTTGCVNPSIKDPRKYALDTPPTTSLDETWVLAAEYTYHFDKMDLKYIGGGTRYHYTLTDDNDGTAISAYTVPIAPFNPAAPISSQPCSATNLFVAPGACAPLTIFPKALTSYEEDERWYSHELNLTSTGDAPLQWLAGVYYYHENYKQPASVQLINQAQFANPISVFGGNAAANPNRLWYDTRPHFQIESYAAFGQIDWQFTETLKFTAGLRYSHDHKFGEEEARLICFALIGCGTSPALLGSFTPAVDITPLAVGSGVDPLTGKLLPGVSKATVIDPASGLAKRELDASWQATTGTLGLDWQPDHDTLVYAKYSRGYKAGGFNAGIVAPIVESPLTDAEHNNAYEIGLKKNFGRTFQANLSAFYYDYSNLQIPVVVVPVGGGTAFTQTVFYNVPKSISQGFEAELTWAPLDDLKLLASYGYNDAYIDQATGVIDASDPTASAPGARKSGPPSASIDTYTGLPQQGQNLSGNALPNAPKNKIALDALYTWHFEPGTVTGSLSYVWRDKQYGNIFPRSYNQAPSWSQVDLRFTFKDAKDRYTIIAYGKNLLDDLGYYGGATSSRINGRLITGQPVVQGIATTYGLTPPRTYGVEFQYRF